MATATQTRVPEGRESAALIGSDKVEGTNVYRSNGDKVGQIERVTFHHPAFGVEALVGAPHGAEPPPAAILTGRAPLLRRPLVEAAAALHVEVLAVGVRPAHGSTRVRGAVPKPKDRTIDELAAVVAPTGFEPVFQP